MNEQELIEKVKNYLIQSDSVYVEDSIEYIGIRENYIISDFPPRDYHFISYDAVADYNNIYSTQSYFVFIEKISEKISYILGPQSSEVVKD